MTTFATHVMQCFDIYPIKKLLPVNEDRETHVVSSKVPY